MWYDIGRIRSIYKTMPTPSRSHISEIDTKILLALLRAPANAYKIARLMEFDSDNMIKVSNGALLPALKRLQKNKAVTKMTDNTYSVSAKGKKLLEDEISSYIKLIYLSRQRKL